MIRQLRPDQQECLDAVRQSVGQGVRKIVVQAPCGWGKTVWSSAVVERALARGNRVVFVVSSLSLIDQTVAKFYAEGIREIGVIQANHPMEDWSRPVQVVSIQTVHSRQVMPEGAVVIIDECHVLHQRHKSWLAESPAIFIGLSATPYTKNLGRHFESLITAATTREMIDANVLCRPVYYAAAHVDTKARLRAVKIATSVQTGEKDYAIDELGDVMRENEISADVVHTWRRLWGKPKSLVFAVDLAHALDLQQRFTAAGVRCGYQDAQTKRQGYWTTGERWVDGRSDLAKKFASGELDVIVNVGTLTTGVDWDVRYLGLARPTKSEILYKQIVGRALRTAEGKPHAIIADHGGVTEELGFAEDIEYDALHKGADRPEPRHVSPVRKPKLCLSCGALRAAGGPCPACGFVPAPTNRVLETDDELEVVDRARRAKGQKREWTIEQKADFFAQLKSYARTKFYKTGWAAQKYRDKFGEWPNDPRIKHAPSQEPTPAVVSWIKSTQIRWAKSQRNPSNALSTHSR